jgi:sterol desaturase/sphingolipid hydroxylase (fatty acid hydroxylase superfamily)
MNTDVLPPPLASPVDWSPPQRDQRRRAPRTPRITIAIIAGAAAALASAIWLGNSAAIVSIPALLAISWPLERIWRRHPVPVRRIGLRTDLAYAAAGPALQFVGLVVGGLVGVLSLAWLPALAFRPLVTSMPFWVQVVAGIGLFDVLVYWAHRWAHSVPLLWKFHSVHHSSRHMDWISGIRNHPFDGVFMAPAFAFLIGAGFDGAFVGGLAVIQFVIGLWAHLNVRWRLRPLRAVILTPDFHHWHHANQPEAFGKNLSVFLPIWDILFGTYYMPTDRRPMTYGVDDPVPDHLFGQLAYPLRGLRHDWRAMRERRRNPRSTVAS